MLSSQSDLYLSAGVEDLRDPYHQKTIGMVIDV